MAPEQCKAGGEVDSRADLYALGCILFELLVGGPPFNAPGGGEIMAMHIYEPPPRLHSFAPHLPVELDALVAKLLVKTPADRTPSAAYALAELERVSLMPLAAQIVLLGPGGQRAPTYGPAPEYPEPGALPRWIPAAVLLVAVAIAVVAVIVIGGSAELPGAK